MFVCARVRVCLRACVVGQMRPLLCRKFFFFSLNHVFKSPQICFWRLGAAEVMDLFNERSLHLSANIIWGSTPTANILSNGLKRRKCGCIAVSKLNGKKRRKNFLVRSSMMVLVWIVAAEGDSCCSTLMCSSYGPSYTVYLKPILNFTPNLLSVITF